MHGRYPSVVRRGRAELARPRARRALYGVGIARQPLLARDERASLGVVDKRGRQRTLRHVVAPDLVNANHHVPQRLELVVNATGTPVPRIHEEDARLVGRYLWPR